MDPGSAGFMHLQTEGSGHILTGVQNSLASRCMDQITGTLLPHDDRCGKSGGQLTLRRIRSSCRAGRYGWQSVIPFLTVIDIGEENVASGYLPAVICSDDLLRSVCIGQNQIRDQFPGIAVIGRSGRVKAEASLVPAIAQFNRQGTRCLQLCCHIISLVLHPGVIVVAVRGQVFTADLFSVPAGLIQAQTTDIQSGSGYRLPRMNFLVENRMSWLLVGTTDPGSRPCFILAARLEPVFLTDRFLACVSSYRDSPGIAGSGAKREIHLCGQTVQISPAGISHHRRPMAHSQAGSDCFFSFRLLYDPGKDRIPQIVTDGICQVVHFAFCDMHGDSSR